MYWCAGVSRRQLLADRLHTLVCRADREEWEVRNAVTPPFVLRMKTGFGRIVTVNGAEEGISV